MNLWECEGREATGERCARSCVGLGGAIGLRAIGWQFTIGGEVLCPLHRSLTTPCTEVGDNHGKPCGPCAGGQISAALQALMVDDRPARKIPEGGDVELRGAGGVAYREVRIGEPIRHARGVCPLCGASVYGTIFARLDSGEVSLPLRGSRAGHLDSCAHVSRPTTAGDAPSAVGLPLQGVELADGTRIEVGAIEGLEDLLPPELLDDLRTAGLASGYALTLSGGSVESRLGDNVPLVLILKGAQLETLATTMAAVCDPKESLSSFVTESGGRITVASRAQGIRLKVEESIAGRGKYDDSEWNEEASITLTGRELEILARAGWSALPRAILLALVGLPE